MTTTPATFNARHAGYLASADRLPARLTAATVIAEVGISAAAKTFGSLYADAIKTSEANGRFWAACYSWCCRAELKARGLTY